MTAASLSRLSDGGSTLHDVMASDGGRWAAFRDDYRRLAWLDGNDQGWAAWVGCFDRPGEPSKNEGNGRFNTTAVPLLLRTLDFDESRSRGWLLGDHEPTIQEVSSVYFIRASNGLIKIGHSTDPANRLDQLRTGSPVRLSLLGVIPSAGPEGETALHQRFAAQRSHGEWFLPSPELATFIAENARPL